MWYYKVKKDMIHDYFSGYTTVINELLTERERNTKFRYLNDDVFELVNISKRNTHVFMGCRFENSESEYFNDDNIVLRG